MRIQLDPNAIDVFAQSRVGDLIEELHFEAIRQWQFIEFSRDRFRAQRIDRASDSQIDVRVS